MGKNSDYNYYNFQDLIPKVAFVVALLLVLFVWHTTLNWVLAFTLNGVVIALRIIFIVDSLANLSITRASLHIQCQDLLDKIFL